MSQRAGERSGPGQAESVRRARGRGNTTGGARGGDRGLALLRRASWDPRGLLRKLVIGEAIGERRRGQR